MKYNVPYVTPSHAKVKKTWKDSQNVVPILLLGIGYFILDISLETSICITFQGFFS